jgi:hypothetical protein
MLILALTVFFNIHLIYSVPFPSFILNSTIPIPNSNSLGQDNCKQF